MPYCFAWLDAIKQCKYLQAMLGDNPNRFAEVFRIAE